MFRSKYWGVGGDVLGIYTKVARLISGGVIPGGEGGLYLGGAYIQGAYNRMYFFVDR